MISITCELLRKQVGEVEICPTRLNGGEQNLYQNGDMKYFEIEFTSNCSSTVANSISETEIACFSWYFHLFVIWMMNSSCFYKFEYIQFLFLHIWKTSQSRPVVTGAGKMYTRFGVNGTTWICDWMREVLFILKFCQCWFHSWTE